MEKRKGDRLWIVGVSVFILYLFAMAYFLFFSESFGRNQVFDEYRYNLIPFREINRYFNNIDTLTPYWFIINIFGNIIVFIPYGMFLPIVLRRTGSWISIICMSLLFSLIIETIQLLTRVGIFDIDDILMNTAGALGGYFIYRIVKWIKSAMMGSQR